MRSSDRFPPLALPPLPPAGEGRGEGNLFAHGRLPCLALPARCALSSCRGCFSITRNGRSSDLHVWSPRVHGPGFDLHVCSSEVHGPSSDLHVWSSAVHGAELRSPRLQLRAPRAELRSPRLELRGPRPEFRPPRSELRSARSRLPAPCDAWIHPGAAVGRDPPDVAGVLTRRTPVASRYAGGAHGDRTASVATRAAPMPATTRARCCWPGTTSSATRSALPRAAGGAVPMACKLIAAANARSAQGKAKATPADRQPTHAHRLCGCWH